MKCKKCGMRYDGPAEKFTGICPLCAQTPAEREQARRTREDDAQMDREQHEAYIQGHVGG